MSATQGGTRIDEIAGGLYRISTPVGEAVPGGFTFNQFLLVDEDSLLFHTGPRKLFPMTLAAVKRVLAPSSLRWISFSHYEADECGALNEWLEVAPRAQPLCSQLAALVSVGDIALREPRGLVDGERVKLGRRTVRWLDAPHVPHAMECGYLYDETERVLLCGDLFSQPGSEVPPLTESADAIWGPSEAMRQGFPYAPVNNVGAIMDKFVALQPQVLACMHGSSFRGDGAALLGRLRAALSG